MCHLDLYARLSEKKVDYEKIDGIHHIEITTKTNSQELYNLYYDWDKIQPLAGYIIIKDNMVYFNEVEIVEWKIRKSKRT